MSALDQIESEYGLSLVLHSEANKNVFKSNKPTSFTNIFKKPVKLSDDGVYEIGLGNLHIPLHQSVLVKDDFERSYIQYNMGMFQYDSSEGKWCLMENSHRKLWRLAPNADFEGINEQNISTLQKMEYIKRLTESLTLGNHSNADDRCFKYFLHTVSKGAGQMVNTIIDEFNPATNKPFGFYTLPTTQTQEERYDFFEKIMSLLSIDPISYVKDVCYSFRKNDIRLIERIFHKIKLENRGNLSRLKELYYNDLFKFLWDKKPKREPLNSETNAPIIAMYITYGDRMSKFLSVDYNTRVFVGYCMMHYINPYDSNQKLLPKFGKTNIDSIFVYCDLVEHSVCVGDALTNFLQIVTVNKNLANMTNPIHIFRPIAHRYFQSASIKLRDQFGEELDFEKGSFSAIEIVIRKR